MKTNLKITVAMFAATITGLAFFSSCKKDTNTSPGAQSTTYSMYMTDAPANYQQVNVNIIGAQVNSASSGWVALKVNAGIYNLLNLCNGKDTLLASGQVAVGGVSQVRLLLGETGNTVMVNGVLYPLQTPSAQQSGLKLLLNATLVSGVAYNVVLDFDAGMSIVATGNGSYILKPVIRAVVPPVNGGISGVVNPFNIQSSVYVTNGVDTAASYTSMVAGGFVVQGLAAGMYKVTIVPPPPYSVVTYTSIVVNAGTVTDLGTITFQ